MPEAVSDCKKNAGSIFFTPLGCSLLKVTNKKSNEQ